MSRISSLPNRYARFLIAMSFFGCLMFAQGPSKLEGWKPYTPTRLDWLAVDLNASLRIAGIMESSHFNMGFIPLEKEDAILIYVAYLPEANREAIKISVNYAKKVIAIKAKALGWSWLTVKEKIELGVTPDER